MMALLYCEIEVINLAICWKSSQSWNTLIRSKNFQWWTQSARNCFFIILLNNNVKCIITTDSSETKCKTSFNFFAFHTIYSHFYPNRQPISNHWLEWFIGFSEGDGSILTNIRSKEKRTELSFVITQKEKEILIHIQEILGFGSILHVVKGNHYRYTVQDNKNILILCNLFNGNLVIKNRIIQLNKWAEHLNKTIKNKNSHLRTRNHVNESFLIDFIWNPVHFTLNDAWLSGFTDAEGNFTCNVSNPTITRNKHTCNIRFVLDQKDWQDILIYITSLFNGGRVYHRKETKDVYRI